MEIKWCSWIPSHTAIMLHVAPLLLMPAAWPVLTAWSHKKASTFQGGRAACSTLPVGYKMLDKIPSGRSLLWRSFSSGEFIDVVAARNSLGGKVSVAIHLHRCHRTWWNMAVRLVSSAIRNEQVFVVRLQTARRPFRVLLVTSPVCCCSMGSHLWLCWTALCSLEAASSSHARCFPVAGVMFESCGILVPQDLLGALGVTGNCLPTLRCLNHCIREIGLFTRTKPLLLNASARFICLKACVPLLSRFINVSYNTGLHQSIHRLN